MSKFPTLFSQGNIGKLRLKNRLIMNAMGTVLTDGTGNPSQRMLDYYKARAAGGIGLVTTQCAGVSKDGSPGWELGIYNDSFIPGIKSIVDTIHDNGGKASIQLMHNGLLITFSGFVPEGMIIKVPSITPWLNPAWKYAELTEEDINRYIDDFAQAARRAKEAGADAVELHACHGCLVSTFMSPITNRRSDKYGGSKENRLRFAKSIVEQIKKATGKPFPLIVKINATDDLEGGISMDEVLYQAKELEKAGANAISVSSSLEFWCASSIPCYAYPDGAMLAPAEKVKKAVKVPVIVAGKIDAALGEKTLKAGKADFIAMGRPVLADPELPDKLKAGKLEEICPCVYCNNCVRTDPSSGPCSVNPFLFREAKLPLSKADKAKTIMVIGGGIAGMQASILMSKRGHKVTLHEKGKSLGGQWTIAANVPGKERFNDFTAYLERSMKKAGVKVNLKSEITREDVIDIKPDAVIIATGAVPATIPVKGIDGKNVVQAIDVITGKAKVKGKCVVIGGRFIGLEVALLLAEQGKEVTIVTKALLGENGSKLERMTYRTLARKLIDMRMPMFVNTSVIEIADKAVIMNWGGEIFSLSADTVILAVGAKPVDQLAHELEGVVPEVHIIGDSAKPSDAAAAVAAAAKIATKI
ncbi:MAG: NAD(P)/FAD-dependent oxidoreductase [Dehalococcoidia bacterium]|jgi:2,4-dienoyl-CoA reductase-like NADH-dependent reductase (Old Yellow Enzyme family)/thioredoxin reductase